MKFRSRGLSVLSGRGAHLETRIYNSARLTDKPDKWRKEGICLFCRVTLAMKLLCVLQKKLTDKTDKSNLVENCFSAFCSTLQKLPSLKTMMAESRKYGG